MSVYIHGMEMPTSCSDCPMCYDMMECTVGTPRIGFWKNEMKAEPFDFCTERHPRCPLVPVPDHGRLIDADALMLRVDVHGTNKFGMLDDDIREFVNFAPTIIPADKEGET